MSGWISKELAAKWGIEPQQVEDLGWTSLGILTVQSGRLWVGDPSFAPSETEGKVVALPPDEYEARGRLLSIDGEERVANVIFAPLALETTRGDELGETWTDTAHYGFGDFDALLVTITDGDAFYDAYVAHIEELRAVPFAYGGAVMLLVSSSDDGTAKLFERLHGGQRVGFEVELIDPDGGFKVLP